MRIWNLFGLINVCRQLSWRLGLRRQTIEKCHTETSEKLEPEDRRQDRGNGGAMVQFSGVPKGGGAGVGEWPLRWSCCMHVCLCVTGEGLKERSNLWFVRE